MSHRLSQHPPALAFQYKLTETIVGVDHKTIGEDNVWARFSLAFTVTFPYLVWKGEIYRYIDINRQTTSFHLLGGFNFRLRGCLSVLAGEGSVQCLNRGAESLKFLSLKWEKFPVGGIGSFTLQLTENWWKVFWLLHSSFPHVTFVLSCGNKYRELTWADMVTNKLWGEVRLSYSPGTK